MKCLNLDFEELEKFWNFLFSYRAAEVSYFKILKSSYQRRYMSKIIQLVILTFDDLDLF